MDSLTRIYNFSKNRSKIVIVGAGKQGKELAGFLIDRDLIPYSFFDNDASLTGLSIYGVTVSRPRKLEDGTYYIISVLDDYLRYKLRQQLISLGVQREDIICYYSKRCGDYHRELSDKNYKNEISDFFMERLGTEMNWNNPTTYSEIINWEKLNVNDKVRTSLADKALVKDWVAQRIGSQYVVKTYGCWKRVEDVDYDALPDKFVIKVNNGSGRNIIVDDKNNIDREEINHRLSYWLQANFYYDGFEEQYKDIEPQIIAEEYLEGVGTTVYDYNIFCFYGEPEYIWCIKGSHRPGCTAAFYDKRWNVQPFSYGYPLDVYPAPKPEKLEKMLELSRVLSKDFRHVRVDWYNLPDGRVFFGEMTFSTWAGLRKFLPSKYDVIFGNMINKGDFDI